MKKLLFLLLFFSIAKQSLSQNPRKHMPIGINVHLGGPGFALGASIDAFIIPAINIEAGTGVHFFGLNYFGGIKYHTESESNSNWSLFGGAILIAGKPDGDAGYVSSIEQKYAGVVYLPVGIQYIADHGFTFGIEVAGVIDNNSVFHEYKDFYTWFGIKLGIHFSIKDNLPKPKKRKSTYKDENFEYHID